MNKDKEHMFDQLIFDQFGITTAVLKLAKSETTPDVDSVIRLIHQAFGFMKTATSETEKYKLVQQYIIDLYNRVSDKHMLVMTITLDDNTSRVLPGPELSIYKRSLLLAANKSIWPAHTKSTTPDVIINKEIRKMYTNKEFPRYVYIEAIDSIKLHIEKWSTLQHTFKKDLCTITDVNERRVLQRDSYRAGVALHVLHLVNALLCKKTPIQCVHTAIVLELIQDMVNIGIISSLVAKFIIRLLEIVNDAHGVKYVKRRIK